MDLLTFADYAPEALTKEEREFIDNLPQPKDDDCCECCGRSFD